LYSSIHRFITLTAFLSSYFLNFKRWAEKTLKHI